MQHVADQKLHRRTLLKWAGGAVGLAILDAGLLPGIASAASHNGRTTAAGSRRILVPGSSRAALMPVQLGVELTADTAAGLPKGSVISFEFDPRLYELAQRPAAQAGVRPFQVSSGPTAPNGKDHRVLLSVLTDEDLAPGEQLTLIVGQIKPRQYPTEILRDLDSLNAGLRPGRSGARSPLAVGRQDDETLKVQPWGLAAGALWEKTSWEDGAYYTYFARRASIASVGPGPAPAGFRLHVMTDAAVIADMRLAEVRGPDGPAPGRLLRTDSRGGVMHLAWESARSLPVGETLTFYLEVAPRSLAGGLPALKHPIVTAVADAAPWAAQRTTYLESVVRDDSVYDAETSARFSWPA